MTHYAEGLGIRRPSGVIEDVGMGAKAIYSNANNSTTASFENLVAVTEPKKKDNRATREGKYEKILERIRREQPGVDMALVEHDVRVRGHWPPRLGEDTTYEDDSCSIRFIGEGVDLGLRTLSRKGDVRVLEVPETYVASRD